MVDRGGGVLGELPGEQTHPGERRTDVAWDGRVRALQSGVRPARPETFPASVRPTLLNPGPHRSHLILVPQLRTSVRYFLAPAEQHRKNSAPGERVVGRIDVTVGVGLLGWYRDRVVATEYASELSVRWTSEREIGSLIIVRLTGVSIQACRRRARPLGKRLAHLPPLADAISHRAAGRRRADR